MDYHTPFLTGEFDDAGFRLDAAVQDDQESPPVAAVDMHGNLLDPDGNIIGHEDDGR
ncbi:hypothetical protein HF670_05155 [Acidithiobacillus thiooxidans]|jgi:hypothetical protein|uniref:hypothetical protein n=1 Tax=Acidithiobacillus TaxID=119977 RepID=UPI0004AD6481|nr:MULTISPECIES: hypothetical protein [Acidithiobacillus]MBU2740372.1 hypothetical protein [Acidithiobacillus albertensis]MBU2792461.1 hypothetical protein [Acidithiobacillus thiooxidans]MBU2838958.1 hypothetical protein [Acidithiobacillus thiooxidans]MBU2843246.1 hypothetical protein [Acidithiobacillus thiooxidans]